MSQRDNIKNRVNGIKSLIASAPTEVLIGHLVEAVQFLLDHYVESLPPDGKKQVSNFYVEMVEGNPKLRVEYEE